MDMTSAEEMGVSKEEFAKLRAKSKQDWKKHFNDEATNGALIPESDLSIEGCRSTDAITTLTMACATERRMIYIYLTDTGLVYTSYDFKTMAWEKPSTVIHSSQTAWTIQKDRDSASVEFNNDGYLYRVVIDHLSSTHSGTVTVIKTGQPIQTETCRLLHSVL